MTTSSLTTSPPVSRTLFQLTPKSFRLILAFCRETDSLGAHEVDGTGELTVEGDGFCHTAYGQITVEPQFLVAKILHLGADKLDVRMTLGVEEIRRAKVVVSTGVGCVDTERRRILEF